MSFVRRIAVAAAVATVVTSCTGGSPHPPPNAGTLIVHALWQAGPILPNGHAADESAMTHTRLLIRATSGPPVNVTTDEKGNARVLLAPGVYSATFADLAGFDGTGGNLDCGLGAPYPEKVSLLAHRTAHLEVVCGNP